MRTDKLKHLPINVLFSIPAFGMWFFLLSTIVGIPTGTVILLSLYMYMMDIVYHVNNDVLEDRVKILEKRVEDLRNCNTYTVDIDETELKKKQNG